LVLAGWRLKPRLQPREADLRRLHFSLRLSACVLAQAGTRLPTARLHDSGQARLHDSGQAEQAGTGRQADFALYVAAILRSAL